MRGDLIGPDCGRWPGGAPTDSGRHPLAVPGIGEAAFAVGGPFGGYLTNVVFECHHRTFEPEEAAVRSVRHFVVDLTDRCDHGADAAELVASELATNAVLHARSTFDVTVTIDDDFLMVEVYDDNPRMPTPDDPGTGALSGRGLAIVAAVSTSWGVRPAGAGKVVWAQV
jgi:hypothetical protein